MLHDKKKSYESGMPRLSRKRSSFGSRCHRPGLSFSPCSPARLKMPLSACCIVKTSFIALKFFSYLLVIFDECLFCDPFAVACAKPAFGFS